MAFAVLSDPDRITGTPKARSPIIGRCVDIDDFSCHFKPGEKCEHCGHGLPNTDFAYLSDCNPELIATYTAVRDHPEQTIEKYRKHQEMDSEDYYKLIRSAEGVRLNLIDRAARFLYLNGAAWMGMWRENRHGRMNTPYQHLPDSRRTTWPKEDRILLASDVLKRGGVYIAQCDWTQNISKAGKDCVVYADPPYIPRRATASFTGYSSLGFSEDNQIDLAKACWEAAHRGAYVLVSNSDTPATRRIYSKGRFVSVEVAYGIGSETLTEVLIEFLPGNSQQYEKVEQTELNEHEDS